MSERVFQIARLANANRSIFTSMMTRSQIKSFSSDSIDILHDSKNNRFAAQLNGELAVLDYDLKGKTITFLHTEVPNIFRGKGVGKYLAQEAFQYALNNSLKVKIECDFVNKYYNDNSAKYKSITIV